MKRYFTQKLILLVACFFMGISQIVAQTYYVATTGNNDNEGTDPSLPKRTIQAAIFASGGNHVIEVAAGTYAEHLYIDRAVTIKGSNAGVAATAWINPETIVRPATTSFATDASSAVIELRHNSITIDGVAVLGDNPALSDAAPVVINGVSSRANYGAMAYESFSGLKILNSKFANFVRRGISLAIYDPNTIASGANEIKNSSFDNVVKSGDNNGAAIYLSNYITEISNNTIAKVDRGLFYETNAAVTHTSPLLMVNNNISSYFQGFLMYCGGASINPATEIKTNVFTWQNISGRSGDGITITSNNSSRGVVIERARGTATILVQDNNITNYNDGIAALSVEKNTNDLNKFTIKGGTVTNAGNVGVLVSNYVNQWEMRAVIKGLTILNAGNGSVFVTSGGNSYNTELALSDGVVLQKDPPLASTNYNQAIYASGSKVIITELGDTKIINAKFNFINLDNDAMSGLEVDGTAMTFDGEVNGYTFSNYTPGLSNDMGIAQALQERIRDKNPFSFGQTAPNAGLIKFNLNVLPVTLTSFTAKAGTNGAQLSWATSSEKNNSHFIVSRSFDGGNFTDLTRIEGKGTSNSENVYTYIDKSFKQSAYYLLKQVDLDGEVTSYSKLVRFVKGLANNVSIYPNPVTDVLNIDLSLPADITIYDISGKRVMFLTKQPVGKLSVNAGVLPVGSYSVVIGDAKGKRHEKFIKR